MKWRSTAVGLMLLATTIGTGIAVEAFGFAGVGRESHVSYYPGEPPGATSTPTPFEPPVTPTKTPSGTSVMFGVDADLAADGLQASRPGSVPNGSNFSVDIVVFGDTVPGYRAYQVLVDFDDVLFDAVDVGTPVTIVGSDGGDDPFLALVARYRATAEKEGS